MREEQAGERKGGSWAPPCDALTRQHDALGRSCFRRPRVARLVHQDAVGWSIVSASWCAPHAEQCGVRNSLGLLGTYRHWHVIARDTMTLRSGGCAHGRGRGRAGTSSPPGAHPPSSLGASTAEESAFKRGVAGMARERPRDGHQGKAFWREVRSSVSTLTNAKNAPVRPH